MRSCPHLCAQDRDGSFHPSLGGGLGCQGRQVPGGLIQSLSQGECQAAASLRGEGAAEPEVREQHGRGAVPGAAAAVSRPEDRRTDRHQVGQREKTRRTHALNIRLIS